MLPDPELDNPIARAAADFVQRQRFWDWTDDDQLALDAWLAASPLHQAAYLRVRGIVGYAEHLAAVHTFKSRWGGLGVGWFFRPLILVPVLTLSSLLMLALAAPALIAYFTDVPVRAFSTDIGGRSTLHFADGTELALNTDTALRYRMSNRERTVWLDRGEAWFHVAHNAANPFTVIVGSHRVTDLGTEFLITRGTDRVKVALINGRADLSSAGAQSATLRPGDEAIATPVSVSVTRKTPAELADELAWRNGMVVFRNTPVADAVREINRYNTLKLVVADPAIAGVKISTNLKVDDVAAFVQLAEVALDLRVERDGNEIRLFGQHQKPAWALRSKRRP